MSYTIGMVPDSLRESAYQAIKEGRLWWRCTDQHGRPDNGGKAEPLTQPGQISEAVAPILCKSGWHVTSQPHRWRGCRVFMVEGIGQQGDQEEDKTVFEQIRILAEVDSEKCLMASIRARCGRKDLQNADLRNADLRWTDLRWAGLRRANLRFADLRNADLRWADLRRANLRFADLRNADLRWANLTGADLTVADLTDANLTDANLTDAYGYKGAE